MCGRYTIANPSKLTDPKRFKLTIVPFHFKPLLNIAPSQEAPVILNTEPAAITMAQWGLIPSWAKDPKIGYKMFNARGETVAEKPSYRGPFRRKRCLVIADGFYEWQKAGKRKVPYRISLKSEDLFTFAGLWDTWSDPKNNKPVTTFTIITTVPNELLQPIHDRMPVILNRDDEPAWLGSDLSEKDAQALLKPFPAAQMQAKEASPLESAR